LQVTLTITLSDNDLCFTFINAVLARASSNTADFAIFLLNDAGTFRDSLIFVGDLGSILSGLMRFLAIFDFFIGFGVIRLWLINNHTVVFTMLLVILLLLGDVVVVLGNGG
jgi:hypothetical protein